MISDVRERLTAYRHGDWLVSCDRCGGEFYASEMRREWTGLIVCRSDWEPRHPQDFKKGVPDRQNPAWVRPEPPDTFVEFGTISLSDNSVESGAAEGTLIGLLSVTGDGAQSFRLLDNAGGRFKLDPADSTRLLAGPVATDIDVSASHSVIVSAAWSSVGQTLTIEVTEGDVAVTFAGVGGLSVAYVKEVGRSAAFAGVGTLAADWTRSRARAVAMAGSGSLSATTAVTRRRAVAFAGVGTLSLAGTHDRAVAFSGVGTLAVDAIRIRARSVAFNGAGSLAAETTVDRQSAVALAGVGSLLVAPTKIVSRSVAFAGTGTLAATFARGFDSGFDAGFR